MGRDLTHDELTRLYDAVVYAVGAQTDRRMGIPGEDLPGSWPATAFVAWYNGHPDFQGLDFDLSCERIVVIGNGNVAVDVARMLALTEEELRPTDTTDDAIASIVNAGVREILVLGRRGPAQAAFTNPELVELTELAGADLIVDPAELALDPASAAALEEDAMGRRNLAVLRETAAAAPARKPRRIRLRFCTSPAALLGNGRVEAVEVVRNELVDDGRGGLRAVPTEEREVIPCGAVLRSVGYRGVPLPGVPFDDERGVIPNEGGRVHDQSGARVPGVYCTGWIKRGPSGVIGTNKKDATETVELLLADARAGLLPAHGLRRRRRRRPVGRARRRGRDAGGVGGDRRRRALARRAGGPSTGQARRLGRAARGRAVARRRAAARLGPVSGERLWGGETDKAIGNFPVSGEPIPAAVAHWLGRIKGAAARVNAELGLLDADKAGRIAAAADRVAAGDLDDQFPIDVFQTGSGTSSNMNANEVIAALAGEGVHANDDVNMGQSSNDVFPSAVHLAALDRIAHDLLPALERLASSLERKAQAFDDVVKSGRTHLMDAVPVTLGQEFSGYAAQVREGIHRVEDALPRLGQIPLGGTATGTGLNTHPEFAERVRALIARDTGLAISAPADPFESQAARDGLVEASGALKVVAVSLTKIANDLRLMGSGPRAGLGELLLPELQKGSSIMPGKVNPVIPEVVTQVAAQVIGNDTAITIGGMNGQFELNVYVPLMARNLLQSIMLLASAGRLLAEKCVDGIEANREQNERYAELTLSAAAALNPYIGYDRAAELVATAAATGRSLRDVAREMGVDEAVLDQALDYHAMAKPHEAL